MQAREIGGSKNVVTTYSSAPGTIEWVTVLAILKSSRSAPMISASWWQRSSMLMLSTATSGVRLQREYAALSGSKSVITTSGRHSRVRVNHSRTVLGSSWPSERTFSTTVAQRRIWPSSIAKLRPKTSSTYGSASPRNL